LTEPTREITVGVLYVGPISKIAQIMVASVRQAMPGAKIVQMTDYTTKPVQGVHEVIRKRWDGKRLMTYRLLHLEEFPPANAVFLDADTVVRKDLTSVFDGEFDVALTRRDATDLTLGEAVLEAMPFNTGVMFSKASGRQFWLAAHAAVRAMPDEHQVWWGDQLAVKKVAEETSLKVAEYPCALYNYTPTSPDEDLSERYVVHYKGRERKPWLLAHWEGLLNKRARR
jgi:lipopolysaccharide biosynthesis glycosyltransferase